MRSGWDPAFSLLIWCPLVCPKFTATVALRLRCCHPHTGTKPPLMLPPLHCPYCHYHTLPLPCCPQPLPQPAGTCEAPQEETSNPRRGADGTGPGSRLRRGQPDPWSSHHPGRLRRLGRRQLGRRGAVEVRARGREPPGGFGSGSGSRGGYEWERQPTAHTERAVDGTEGGRSVAQVNQGSTLHSLQKKRFSGGGARTSPPSESPR